MLYRADLKVLHLAERDVHRQGYTWMELILGMSSLEWLYHIAKSPRSSSLESALIVAET